MNHARKGAIDTVVFDAVGTLIHPTKTVGAIYSEQAQPFGIEITPQDARQRFAVAYEAHGRRCYADWGCDSTEGETSHRTREQAERERWRTIVGDVFAPTAPAGLFERLWNHFADPANWTLYADVEPAWEYLTSRNIGIVIASNFDQRMHRIRDAFPILNRCQRVFVSADLGYLKPQTEFYRSVTEALKVAPEKLMMVGDDLANDYYGPRQSRWQAVHLARNQPRAVERSIGSLQELVHFLD